MASSRETPKALGYRMPAEYARHRRSWMLWPCRERVWPDLAATHRDFVAVAHAIADFEPLRMVVRPEDAARARAMLGADIELIEVPIDDSWARDVLPSFLVDTQGNHAAAVFRFNAWGNKYQPHDKDAALARQVAQRGGLRAFCSAMTAEGGGISVDGAGTILTTRSSFPNPNRNAQWSIAQIEAELMDMLGGEKVIWLPGNPLETETDGHVDNIAVFAGPATVLVEEITDRSDPWYEMARANIAALQGETDAAGRKLKLLHMPAADPACMTNARYDRSYINSYIINNAVIMPQHGVASDGAAREVAQEAFADREIIMVPIREIAIGGGGIHCITHEEPL